MEEYFRSHLNELDNKLNPDTENMFSTNQFQYKMNGATINTPITVVLTINEFCVAQLRNYFEKKHISIISLNQLLKTSQEKVLKTLENEYISNVTIQEKIIDEMIKYIERVYENQMVLIGSIIPSAYLISYVMEILFRCYKCNVYYLNLSLNAMFTLLKEMQNTHPKYLIPKSFLRTISFTYMIVQGPDKHSLPTSKMALKRALQNDFKRWYENEKELNDNVDSTIERLFNRIPESPKPLDDDVFNMKYSMIETSGTYLNIGIADLSNLEPIFSKIIVK